MKSIRLVPTLVIALLSIPAFAGPLVSTGGFATLIASCEAPNIDISVVNYDGVLTANINTQGVDRTNLLSATVTRKSSTQVNAFELASAPGTHPAFDVVIATNKSTDGSFAAFLFAELNNSNVLVSQPVKCFYAQTPR